MSRSLDLPSHPTRACTRRRPPGWLREPLVHFLAIGALLFAADHRLALQRADPLTIVVGAEVETEIRELFRNARGRDPDTKELEALRRTWLDNEVLYREGLSLQVDRGDRAIRERVIFKTLSVVDAGIERPVPHDAELRRWFESQRSRYDEPVRLDFQEAVLVGDGSESAVRAFVDRLHRGAGGDAQAGLRIFKGRPRANVADGYGESFARALEQAPAGEWQALQGRDAWRAVRLDALTPGRPATFEAFRGVALQDWTDARMAERRTEAVRTMAARYDVRHEAAAP